MFEQILEQVLVLLSSDVTFKVLVLLGFISVYIMNRNTTKRLTRLEGLKILKDFLKNVKKR